FIELPKFKAKNLTEQKLQVLWLRYLTEIEEKTEQPPHDLLEVPEIREAIEQLAESAFTKSELESYDKYWDSISSEKTLISEAEETGKEIGRREGEEIGIKKGEEIGIEKGKLEIARKLKKQGMPLTQIAEITGVSIEELSAL
ncbi:MAG: hypothetical protein AAF135_27505, partial [Bacteroidota bacterium]